MTESWQWEQVPSISPLDLLYQQDEQRQQQPLLLQQHQQLPPQHPQRGRIRRERQHQMLRLKRQHSDEQQQNAIRELVDAAVVETETTANAEVLVQQQQHRHRSDEEKLMRDFFHRNDEEQSILSRKQTLMETQSTNYTKKRDSVVQKYKNKELKQTLCQFIGEDIHISNTNKLNRDQTSLPSRDKENKKRNTNSSINSLSMNELSNGVRKMKIAKSIEIDTICDLSTLCPSIVIKLHECQLPDDAVRFLNSININYGRDLFTVETPALAMKYIAFREDKSLTSYNRESALKNVYSWKRKIRSQMDSAITNYNRRQCSVDTCRNRLYYE